MYRMEFAGNLPIVNLTGHANKNKCASQAERRYQHPTHIFDEHCGDNYMVGEELLEQKPEWKSGTVSNILCLSGLSGWATPPGDNRDWSKGWHNAVDDGRPGRSSIEAGGPPTLTGPWLVWTKLRSLDRDPLNRDFPPKSSQYSTCRSASGILSVPHIHLRISSAIWCSCSTVIR